MKTEAKNKKKAIKKENTATPLTHPLDDSEAFWDPAIHMYTTLFTLQQLVGNKEYYFVPQGLIQRYLVPWKKIRSNSYRYDLFSGASSKDLFILAELEPIIKKLELKDM